VIAIGLGVAWALVAALPLLRRGARSGVRGRAGALRPDVEPGSHEHPSRGMRYRISVAQARVASGAGASVVLAALAYAARSQQVYRALVPFAAAGVIHALAEGTATVPP